MTATANQALQANRSGQPRFPGNSRLLSPGSVAELNAFGVVRTSPMKRTFLVFLLSASIGFAAPPPIQTTKSSDKQRFDAPAEIKAFYLKLLESDGTIKRQFDALAKQAKLYGDVHFAPGKPQVVDWYPRRDQWNAGKDFHYDLHFLVIQPLEFGRPKWLESDSAVVSEFHVLHEGTTQIDPKDLNEKEQLLSNKITIQFLGFRTFALSPTKKSQ
jgi:hypothetical protein